jgi:hypothetical protein
MKCCDIQICILVAEINTQKTPERARVQGWNELLIRHEKIPRKRFRWPAELQSSCTTFGKVGELQSHLPCSRSACLRCAP